MEEAAYIDPQLFKKVIIPLVMMKNVVLLAISSPSDEVNYCSQLILMTNRATGELIFHSVLPQYQCEQCTSIITGDKCPHQYETLPAHRNMKQLNIAISLLGSDKLTIDQELFGKVKSATSHMFRSFMNEWSKEPLYRFHERVQVCHTFIDPSGGSTESDFAMATHASENHQFILIGVSRYVNSSDTATEVEAIKQMFYNHFTNIWKQDEYSTAHQIIYVELSSDGFTTQMWIHHLYSLFPDKRHLIHIISGDSNKQGQPGVQTTNGRKHAWTIGLQQLFRVKAFHIAESFISNEPYSMREVIIDQCTRYTKEVEESEGPFDKPKVTYSGKRSGKDDVVTAIAASICHHRERMCRQDYIDLCGKWSIIRM